MTRTALALCAAAMIAACETAPKPPPADRVVTETETTLGDASLNCAAETLEIYFATGETALSTLSMAALEAYAGRYAGCDFRAIEIEGHADAQGSAEINEQVSLARAKAVRDALVASEIDVQRVVMIPLGEREAVTLDGQAVPMNRKTTVTVLY